MKKYYIAVLSACLLIFLQTILLQAEEISDGSKIFYGESEELVDENPEYGLEAVGASDENEDPSRESNLIAQGVCGDDMRWYIYALEETKYILCIEGTGSMYSYDQNSNVSPWSEYKDRIIEAEIADTIESLGNNAFYNCTKLEEATIPSALKTIGEYCFAYCSVLDNISLHDNIESIGSYAFYNCTALRNIEIMCGYASFGNYIFQRCYGLQSVTLPYGVWCVPWGIFAECSNLETVVLPSTMTKLEKNCFLRCSNLTNLITSSVITVIGDSAFKDCPKLIINEQGNCGEDLTWTLSGNYNNGLILTISGEGEMTNYSSQDSVPWKPFRGEIKYLSIPNTITAIGDYAFYGTALQGTITLPEGVEKLGKDAFDRASCTEVVLPSSLRELGERCFTYSNITRISIPEGITKIDYSCFCLCQQLASVQLPESIEIIDHYAFQDCHNLSEITIPNNVTTIGRNAFSWCLNLQRIEIPNCVVSVAQDAFIHCTGLTEVVLSENVTRIELRTFYECTNLKTVHMSENVTYIDEKAFSSCNSLTDVYYGGSEEEWNNITIKSNNDPLLNATIHYEEHPTNIGGMEYVLSMVPYGDNTDYCSEKKIVFKNSIEVTGTGYANLYEKSNPTPIESIFLCENYYDDLKYLIISSDQHQKDTLQLRFDDALFEPSKEYYITIDPGALKFVEIDSETWESLDLGVVFGGIDNSDWVFKTVLDFPRNINNPTDLIEKSLYDLLFEPTFSRMLYALDNKGKGGMCYGWSYVVGAKQLNLSSLSRVLENKRLAEIERPSTELIKYIQLAHISQNKCYKKIEEALNLDDDLELMTRITAFKEGNAEPIIMILEGNGKHAVFPIDVKWNNDKWVIDVIDPNGPSLATVSMEPLNHVLYNPKLNHTKSYPLFSFVTIDKEIDKVSSGIKHSILDQSMYLVNSSFLIKKDGYYQIDNSSGIDDINTDEILYWTDNPTVEIDINANNHIGISDGFREMKAQTDGEATITMDIGNGSTIVQPVDEESITYSIEFVKANDYDDFENTIVDVSTDADVIIKDNNGLIEMDGEGINDVSVTYKAENVIDIKNDVVPGKDTYYFKVINDEIIELGVIASGECGDDLTWKLISDGTLVITGTGEMYDYNTEEVPWIDNRNDIANVIIEPGVTSIGDNVFELCGNLTDVDFPEGLLRIGDTAFSGCCSLTSIIIPSSVTDIGDYAFDNCSSLKEVHFKGEAPTNWVENNTEKQYFFNVTATAYYPFNCQTWTGEVKQNYGGNITWVPYNPNVALSTKQVLLTEGESETVYVTILDDNSITSWVSGDEAIATVDTEGIVTAVSPGETTIEVTFSSGYTETIDVTVEKRLNTVASGQCGDDLTWILTEDGTLNIIGTGEMWDYSYENHSPWYDNKDLIESIIIDSKAESIGAYAFYRCNSIDTITIPDGVVTIGKSAFGFCNSLTNVTIPDGVISIGDSAFTSCQKIHHVWIPDSVSSLGNSAFEHCNGMESIRISTNIDTIGSYTFYDCSSLYNIDIPDGVNAIQDSAFENCYNLVNLIVPDNVISIGDIAFAHCDRLTNVILPESVVKIGRGSFSNCLKLTDIWYKGSEDEWEAIEKSSNWNMMTNLNQTIHYREEFENQDYASDYEYTIIDNMVTLTKYNGNSYEVQIPKLLGEHLVNAIGESTFSGCECLRNVVIPNSVTRVGREAFSYCTNLRSISVPYSINSIGEYAFRNCTSLDSIDIPYDVTNIGNGAFFNCQSLMSINVWDGNNTYSSQDGVLFNRNKTTLIFCPNGKEGKYTVPDSVTNIGESAFCGCGRIRSIIIPEGVVSIGDYAFYDCVNLHSICFKGTEEQWNAISKGRDWNKNTPVSLVFNYAGYSTSPDFILPTDITTIEESAFEDNSMTVVYIPDSCATIEDYAFKDCDQLKQIRIPANCEISEYAFDGCGTLYIFGTVGSPAESYCQSHENCVFIAE